MTNVSLLERAEQQVKGFEHTYSVRHGETYARNLFYLACHAALPAAISVDFLHLLRTNFFFENTEQLPYTAEADLLLSPLCTEIGDELYEMDHEVRDILLQQLIDRYGQQRLKEVAKLLWQYDRRFAPWADREMLERAQQLTALSFVDPAQARQWLTQQSPDDYSLEQKVWFTAVNQEVLLAEKVILPPDERPRAIGVEEPAITNEGDQTQLAPVKGVEPRVGVSPPDVSPIEAKEDKQLTMAKEPGSAYKPSLSQAPPADPSITSTQPSSDLEEEKRITIDEERRLEIAQKRFPLKSTVEALVKYVNDDKPNVLVELEGGQIAWAPTKRIGPEGVSFPSKYLKRGTPVTVVIDDIQETDEGEIHIEVSIPSAKIPPLLDQLRDQFQGKFRHLPRELQNELVRLLLQVPEMEDFKTRNRLLQGIPNRESILFHRTESLRADISGLVDQLSMTRLSDGQWALLVFINNAILFTNGTDISEQLKELRRQLEVFYGQTEQEPPLQEKSAEAPPSQKKTNTSRKTRSSKKTNTSKEKEPTAIGDLFASPLESAPDRTPKKIIEDIEDMLSMTSPRMFTTDVLSIYEDEMRDVLGVIRKMPSSEVYPSMESRDAVLANIRKARDELALAIQELAKKGTSRNFISYIQKCCSYLEDALRHW